MRAGEVCGLTWDDIDFENQVLYVRRSMYYDKDLKTWELKVPKNGKPRAIDFGDSLAHILLIAKHEQQRNKKNLWRFVSESVLSYNQNKR